MTNDISTVNEAWEDFVGTHANSLKYPKRLIEVDLPIARISAHARREKSIRHGHISTLHIWWARRPLAACRAVVCASLWPDPADPLCPPAFRRSALQFIEAFAARAASGSLPQNLRPKLVAEQAKLELGLSPESRARWESIASGELKIDPSSLTDMKLLRLCLLDFIADFANWDNSTIPAYLETSQLLTQAAHMALGGVAGTRPLVLDPFAGGGSIPLESLRVGADAFASDLNPVAVLLNKVVLEYAPKYGEQLARDVEMYAQAILLNARDRLARFFPVDEDGAVPTAYIWARTITCDGPGCGAEIPLLRSLWVMKKRNQNIALEIIVDKKSKRIEFKINNSANTKSVGQATCGGGAATCPVCGFTTPVENVRIQMSAKNGGASDARLIAVVTSHPDTMGQRVRLPSKNDLASIEAAKNQLFEEQAKETTDFPLLPNGKINHLRGFFNICLYGITEWQYIFSPRQALSISTLAELVRDLEIAGDRGYQEAVRTCLATIVNRVAVRCTANCIWDATTNCIMQVFNQGQSLPARWEFAEMSPFIDLGSGWSTSVDYTAKVLRHTAYITNPGTAERASATNHPLPTDSAQAVITDPPYYAAIPYADLSDFFYSWFKRSLSNNHITLLKTELVEKADELVSLAHRAAMYREKDNAWFEKQMQQACEEARRVCAPNGLGVFVFANKETEAWEAMLAALINAGWTVTASWPIDTESTNRLRAKNSAALASSVHLVCRPRENEGGKVVETIGEWRDVLSELPKRIHEWMPRLTAEGVVGADAIFACLGPGLEVFSKYSRVEKSNGEAATLREYLEFVWAAVSTEALTLIFKDADASGLEPDARLTAMWMWTIGGGSDGSTKDEDGESKTKTSDGYTLEFDAARKIAQGLGVHLEQCTSLVEIKGETAKLLPVSARTRYLFGTDSSRTSGRGSTRPKQRTLFDELDEAEAAEAGWTELKGPPPGSTTLDRVHQAMILFAANRGELLKRFLVDDGVGKESRFWKLADNLNKLYPAGSEERRWVEGVLARKRGLGL